MQKNKFDSNTKLIIKYAGEYATSLNSNFVDIEHFLLGILKDNTSIAANILLENDITTSKILSYIKLTSLDNFIFKGNLIDLSSDAVSSIENALDIAEFSLITPDHLLLGILKSPCNKMKRLLEVFKVDGDNLYKELTRKLALPHMFIRNDKKRVLDSKILNLYGKELVSLANNNALDPVIGRDEEISSLIRVLSRRRKNNPAIIGEAGVGKTALVEGLAHLIAKGLVPNNLKDKKIISLDLSAIIAGTKYRGEFEDRVKSIADECIKLKDIILFIDEFHIIMGAGGAEGAIDAANILKPALSRGQIQIIGATTLEEYRKSIEKDLALERRFQKIIVEEPSKEETFKIMHGIKEHFEIFHSVRINDDAINSAINLSTRYFTDKKLPDKAIDLIDEACANYNLAKKNVINSYSTEFSSCIDTKHIEEIVSKYTGIDSFNLDDNTTNAVDFLTRELNENIIGQDEATNKIISAIKRSKIGINDPNRPLSSFIFLGPTGVGKTEICKTLAYGLFKNHKSLLRLDMSEYMDKSSITKLIGASAGYIGYGESTALTDKIRNNPYCVLLLDEIEKAHPDVLNLLLQVLEDGIITDSRHKKINFKNCIIIMTSNIGANKLTNSSLGFLENGNIKLDALNELKKVFKPELINRIDEIVVFNKLSFDNILKIADNMLNNLKKRVEALNYNLEISKNLTEYIAKNGYSDIYGARPLRRFITTEIENPLTDKIISGEIKKGDNILIDFVDNSVSFSQKLGIN